MYNIYYVSRLFPMVNCQAFSHTDGNPNSCVNGFKTCALPFVTAFNWMYTVGWMGQILEIGQYLGLKLSPNHGWGLVGSVLLSLLQ